ncbi:maleylpyruvate isomerase N-terminal domain-containing protein [Actinacidiphila oryziradicis]|uniref:maleylpyruvate isomerase N-terminal domain-containing protein n=1 Tax=Actinacidiphila oryziradicis TaxID=2571141 RepID=UPI0023F3543D|nr:maleylpyruvate isomerase N-terminal domain-containing protein [Actinacidiphila oryziradicis]MCW2874945.1 domain containing protein [Actinacidiphila oryziradicis]
MNGPAPGNGPHLGGGSELPCVPQPRVTLENGDAPIAPSGPVRSSVGPLPSFDHQTLRSLLGAFALGACSRDEGLAIEVHLTDCAACADEALRLSDAVGLLHPEDSLDLDPLLRARVLENCLGRRPARIPVPEWAAPYDAETARLDAFLADLNEPEWHEPVRLSWWKGERILTLCGVLSHLGSVDGLVAVSLGLDDPLGPGSPRTMLDRTNSAAERCRAHRSSLVRHSWRTQTRDIVRTLSFAGSGTGGLPVDYADFVLPMRDALVDRAFECWIHAQDIANALDYPEYGPPSARHLNKMVDLAARMLPSALAARRRAGLTSSPVRLVAAGTPGRSLHLHIEGNGGGHWDISLDSPGALASRDNAIASIALDSVDFCHLAAGHIEPERVAVGQEGDTSAIRDVLFATASLSRL